MGWIQGWSTFGFEFGAWTNFELEFVCSVIWTLNNVLCGRWCQLSLWKPFSVSSWFKTETKSSQKDVTLGFWWRARDGLGDALASSVWSAPKLVPSTCVLTAVDSALLFIAYMSAIQSSPESINRVQIHYSLAKFSGQQCCLRCDRLFTIASQVTASQLTLAVFAMRWANKFIVLENVTPHAATGHFLWDF